jgi:tetratricopeptide (TPR) repeat protein
MKFFVLAIMLAAPLCAAPSLDEGFNHLYNLDFDQAHRTFQDYQKAHPNDSLGPVSDAAAYLFSEFDRLHILQSEFFVHDEHFATDHKLTPDPEIKRRFDAALAAAAKAAERSPDSDNALFATVLRMGLESDYLGLIEKKYAPSLRQMKEARELAEKLLARNPDFADAWVAIGVENYMLSIKPAPVRFFLKLGGAQTNREKGLEKLRIAAEKGRYLAPFARLMLAVAAMRDSNPKQASELLKGLVRDYPRNPLYAQELSRLQAGTAKP